MQLNRYSRKTFSLLFAGVLALSFGANCASFGEGLNDLTTFCNAVGEKCTDQTPPDCVDKLGSEQTVLKKIPDYKGAKACLDKLESCKALPDECWKYAVEKFK